MPLPIREGNSLRGLPPAPSPYFPLRWPFGQPGHSAPSTPHRCGLKSLLPFNTASTILMRPLIMFQLNPFTLFLFFNFFFTFIYFWETEHKWGRGRDRRRHRLPSRLQAPSCQHRARCGAQTQEPWDHDPSRSRTLHRLSHPGAPPPFFLKIFFYIYLFLRERDRAQVEGGFTLFLEFS